MKTIPEKTKQFLSNLVEIMEINSRSDWYENDANEEFNLLKKRIEEHLELDNEIEMRDALRRMEN